MSNWAYDIRDNKVIIKGNKLPDGYRTGDAYFCPSCRSGMYFKSVSSNERSAHFAGHHENWCDIGFTDATHANRNNVDLTGFTLNGLLNEITHPHRNANIQGTGGGNGTGNRGVNPKINTVRKLFHFCAANDPDMVVYEQKTIKDIYCGLNTRFLYTQYIAGLHLVFCDYVSPDSVRHLLKFAYPNAAHKVIDIICHIQDDKLFDRCYKLFRGHNNRPSLVFAEFSRYGNRCEIIHEKQLIPLRGR